MDQPDWKGPLGEAFDQALAYLEGLPGRPLTGSATLTISAIISGKRSGATIDASVTTRSNWSSSKPSSSRERESPVSRKELGS